MVKLLTANLLQSHIKGVKNGYPLGLSATELKETNVDYDPVRLVPAGWTLSHIRVSH